MHVFGLELKSIGQILLVGAVFGVGLPVVFSLGIRAAAWGTGGDAEVGAGGAIGGTARPHPLGRALAVLCFAVVVLAVALALTYIVASGFGKVLDFSTVIPTIKDK